MSYLQHLAAECQDTVDSPPTLVGSFLLCGPWTSPRLQPPHQREVKNCQLLLPSSSRSAVVPVPLVRCQGVFLAPWCPSQALKGSQSRVGERRSRSKPRTWEVGSDKRWGWQRLELLQTTDTATWTTPLSPLLWCGLMWDLKRLITSSRSVLLSDPGVLAPRRTHSFYLSLGLQGLITAHKMAF